MAREQAAARPEVDLAGRLAVVTGASRGLGRAIALGLASAGANLVLVARDEGRLEETAGLIRDRTGRSPHVAPADVTSAGAIEQVRESTERRFGAPTILVNGAATFGPLAVFSETDPDDWVLTLMVNTVGAYLTCRAFVPGMLAHGWGRIVNISSAASLYTPGPLDSAYSTSKAALNRFTRHLAAELDGTGVAATVMHPGSVKTEMWADIRDQVAALGDVGHAFRDWVELVERTGGDSSLRGVELVLELVDPRSAGRNGEFCWIRDPLEEPVPSW